ncbi:hypothetical protein FRC18_011915 [Serendipita sp. 400]|nr:hypothetical protein FRC18_011915 [Serendipita sp. 400]
MTVEMEQKSPALILFVYFLLRAYIGAKVLNAELVASGHKRKVEEERERKEVKSHQMDAEKATEIAEKSKVKKRRERGRVCERPG